MTSHTPPGPSRARARDEIDVEAGTVFLGDLHVDTEDTAQVAAFEATLAALSRAPRIVFVGDLFEYWTGPRQATSPGARRALAAMRAVRERGVALDVVPGNRDFLLGSTFEAASGAHLRQDGLVGRLPGGERLLVIHGDELCTLDVDYLRMRRVLRSGAVRALSHRTPGFVSDWVARRLRAASRRAVAAKPPERTRQQPAEVVRMARGAAAATLLCGHAHEFRDESVDGVRWIVLDAWGGERDLVVVGKDGALDATRATAPVAATL